MANTKIPLKMIYPNNFKKLLGWLGHSTQVQIYLNFIRANFNKI